MTGNNELTLPGSSSAAVSAAMLAAHSADISTSLLVIEAAQRLALKQATKRIRPTQFGANEFVRLSELLRSAISNRDEAVFSCQTASVTAGTYSESEGLRKYRLKDEHGTEDEFARPSPRRPSDLQSNVGTVKHLDPPAPVTDERPHASLLATDRALSSELRLEALREWIASDPDAASQFIASELHRKDLQSNWSRIVIYAAEAIRFQDSRVREQVASDLLDHAMRLRDSRSSEDAPVVLCSIRRAGSIIPEGRVSEFLSLLTAGSPIDTRLVTLQAITAVFDCTPPTSTIDVQKLSERVVTLAEKHWDTDVFKAGEVSAIAIEATIAATVLGSSQAIDLGTLALRTRRQLLVSKLRKRLQLIMQNWHSVSPRSHKVELIETMVSHLNSAG